MFVFPKKDLLTVSFPAGPSEEPIRAEIFSIARLEAHAESLARAQTVTSDPSAGIAIEPQVAENRRILEHAYEMVTHAVENHRAITPAAEWLIDNFHIVRALLKEIHDYLPPEYYKELPKLASGHLEGYPRIYGIAWAFVAHSDSRFDPEQLKHFITAYQKVQPLTTGELWAISVTIRVVLIENLRRLAVLIGHSQASRRSADRIADEILGLSEGQARSVADILEELERESFNASFAVQLLQRLRFQDAPVDPVLEWLEARFQHEKLQVDEIVSREHNSQTAANATVRNIITSARSISVFSWQDFFEELSLVNGILLEHPTYREMDFASRDHYRHALEELAKYSDASELEVARLTINKTKEAAQGTRESDPGYYLISSGREKVEKTIGFRPTARMRFNRWMKRNAEAVYILSILGCTLLLLTVIESLTDSDLNNVPTLFILGLVVSFPAAEISVALVNRIIVALLGPQHLPRLSLEEAGVPEHLKTFVVVPTMLAASEKLNEQLEQLEAHYLANPAGHVYFALLTDWTDSNQEKNSGEDEQLEITAERLRQLNEKYAHVRGNADLFHIFHRRRLFNPQEGKWMGWERKRGKLHEFNRLLLGHRDTSYISFGGKPIVYPSGVRYVVTLDADTKMPIGAVLQLVGTIAHPLNRAYFDPDKGRVTEGYGILQPRITATLPSTQNSTIYQRLTSGPGGVDPYASAVSDVYQDLFGEGSFTGKGIYDVAAFEAAMKDRVPENTLLSHDLLEGNFARCGFVSDVEFFEEFPSHGGVATLRNHRWARGDWQLLPWIFGKQRRSIPLIGRWKMIDNLRRSLTNPMTFLTLILPFALLNQDIGLWFGLVFFSLGFSPFLTLVTEIYPKPLAVTYPQHISFLFNNFGNDIARALMLLAMLPYHAWMSVDAIVRALYRLFISHKKMLEWTTAAQAKSSAKLELKDFFWSMRGAFLPVFFAAVIILWKNPDGVSFFYLLLLFWVPSPWLAYYCSNPATMKPVEPVPAENIQLLHLAGRRIWRFFAVFVNSQERFLPPDNFQEDPIPVIAHRSSPTNFGLYLLSVLAARDFGWIGVGEMSQRLLETLQSLLQLEKHQGHFFNWYETTEARPLEPRYISSVDNGNLAGHLLAVAQGCLEKLNEPIPKTCFHRGILHTFALLDESLSLIDLETDSRKEDGARLCILAKSLVATLFASERGEGSRLEYWSKLHQQSQSLLKSAESFTHDRSEFRYREVLAWSRAIADEISSQRADYVQMVSWSDFDLSRVPEGSPAWTSVAASLAMDVPLKDIDRHCQSLIQEILRLGHPAMGLAFVEPLLECLESSALAAREQVRQLQEVHRICHQLFREMDFSILYNPTRKLFSIGLRVNENVLDPSYYDLLASESRLTSFIAIAKGDVPAAHWFSLGRTLTSTEYGAVLLSWSGSMFEYLMPSLVMQTPPGSLLEQTCRLVIKKQIAYGVENHVPWGISESAYNKRDLQFTYQYHCFGVPDLGLKRGLRSDLVIAPYASFLAAMLNLPDSAGNLKRLRNQGAMGAFGFYESVDYTESRLPEGQALATIKTYMAHHQGMSLVSLANIFKDEVMRKRFHAEPLVQATELLLQERMPRNVRTVKHNEESFQMALVREVAETVLRSYHTVNRAIPTTEMISNGTYSVMVTSSGSGFSRFGDLALTRWREDVTLDNWGSYFYLKDLTSQKVWSASYQPTCAVSDSYEVDFAEDRVKFRRMDNELECQLEIFVSPEDNAEVRRITLTNHSSEVREIEVTSYLEVVMNTPAADAAHPAFSNLFVQTEFLSNINALFATRRPRSSSEKSLWMAHVLQTDEQAFGDIEYETDRSQFLGRGQSVRSAKAIYTNAHLSNSVGNVLDPVLSLRARVRLEPGMSTNLNYSTLVADNREDLLLLAEKFHDRANYERASSLAWTQAQVKLNYLNIQPIEAHQFQRLATRLFYSDASLRPSGETIKRNTKNVTGLWAHGISGDLPMVLLRIDDIEDRGIVRQLLQAQEYLATKRFAVDLVIINQKANSYMQELQTAIEAMVHSSAVGMHSPLPQSRGKVFVLRGDLLSQADLDLLYSEARVVLSSRLGSLAEQVRRLQKVASPVSMITAAGTDLYQKERMNLNLPSLRLFNGLGGFSQDGREYVIILKGSEQTPAPWINVIANPLFGFQVSESGCGYTWAMNSRENQLTPWSNDPVRDPCGEAFYILDRSSGHLWSPTAQPIRVENSVYITSHGHGYSRFEHLSHGIHSELTQFVDSKEPVKISRIRIENRSKSIRLLSVTGYVEWVLGFSRPVMAPTTITELDESSKMIFAQNARHAEFGTRIAFAGFIASGDRTSSTGDRTEFFGRNGHAGAPAGIFQLAGFSGRMGATYDPCAAQQTEIELMPGQFHELVFVLGQADDRSEARAIVDRLRERPVDTVLKEVVNQWRNILGKVTVTTPDPQMDLQLNGWLLYQTLVCRIWSRSAFYQAGGAFGFRDQLQDVMALMVSKPELAREQILRAAGRQFVEGDVQHWWHPPTGRGVRTHFSDDLLWLPFVVSHYLKTTNDQSILQVEVPYIEGPLLRPDQEDSYFTPTLSYLSGTVYEHCALALDRSLKVGAHQLPLMGSGDWNDGMNRIGREGKGESVWLAWFLQVNLLQFAPIAEMRGQSERAQAWAAHASRLIAAVEDQAWDGDWYRRAYFDDGTPVGSAGNSECQIDSLAQTWAVISGGGDPERAAQAMRSLEKYLIRIPEKMILLFTPPFEKTPLDPGYIKGYVPGVRENGGQYTHAAAWCVIAYAMMGDGKRAYELFSMLNPVQHTLNREMVEHYKVEPYVVAGDVYSEPQHIGRGGWSWYTGSSGWMYRAGLEYILGFQVQGNVVTIDPRVPASWDQFEIHYRYGNSDYQFRVQMKPDVEEQDLTIQLQDDGKAHVVTVVRKLSQ
jgi:cyclic beta-1,2-glucan synthetase